MSVTYQNVFCPFILIAFKMTEIFSDRANIFHLLFTSLKLPKYLLDTDLLDCGGQTMFNLNKQTHVKLHCTVNIGC